MVPEGAFAHMAMLVTKGFEVAFGKYECVAYLS